jgi:hypothetical protein
LPASGKVDRKALVKPEITVDTGRQLEAPATPMEELQSRDLARRRDEARGL